MIVQGLKSTGISMPIRVDANGRISVSLDAVIAALSVTVSNFPSTQYVKIEDNVKVHPSGVFTNIQNASLAAGTNVISGITVPATLHYRFKRINFTYIGTVAGVIIRPYIISSGVNYYLGEYRGLTSGVYVNDNYDVIMNDGDNLSVQVVGATAGNGFYAFAFLERLS